MLEQTASLFTPITVAYHWVHQAVEILDQYVQDVTQCEDKFGIHTTPLPQNFALARNFSLSLIHKCFSFS
jgi:hypothetical protein